MHTYGKDKHFIYLLENINVQLQKQKELQLLKDELNQQMKSFDFFNKVQEGLVEKEIQNLIHYINMKEKRRTPKLNNKNIRIV